jgi:hypothetical protein
MACAGYLVRSNTTVVYAEIVNGMLICTSAAQHRAAKTAEEEEPDAGGASASLPLLTPKPMRRASSSFVDKLKRRASDASTQPEDEPSDSDEDRADPAYRTQPQDDKVHEAPRVVQLSGHGVEVVDCADEADYESVVELMPFSFRVKTMRMTLNADASCSYTPADTLLLAAVDQATKDEWMKRLPKWSRYGWRETTMLSATEEDAQLLELGLQRWRDSEASSVVKPTAFLFGYAAAAATRSSSSRRRFYRHTGSVSAGYAPIDATCPDDDSAWHQARVIKTHI